MMRSDKPLGDSLAICIRPTHIKAAQVGLMAAAALGYGASVLPRRPNVLDGKMSP